MTFGDCGGSGAIGSRLPLLYVAFQFPVALTGKVGIVDIREVVAADPAALGCDGVLVGALVGNL